MRARPGDGDHDADLGGLPLDLFIEAARDAIIVTDIRGTILAASPPAVEMLRISEGAARGLGIAAFLGDLPNAPTLEPTTVRATRADGSSITVELTVSRFGRNGTPIVALVLRDVSARTRRETDARLERRALEDAVQSLQAFSYVVSHDLKEPVRALGAYLDEARGARDLDEARELVGRAHRAHENLGRLLDGLLEWSRTVTTPLEPEAVRIPDLLADPACRTQFENLLQERGVVLEVDPDLPTVYATPTLLGRVLGNLITNAIRHNPSNSPQVRIRAMDARPGSAAIAIDDNGPGFPPPLVADQPSTAQAPATIKKGFGLAIARRAVVRLGGSLYFANRPEGGGRAILTLPTPTRVRTLDDRLRELI